MIGLDVDRVLGWWRFDRWDDAGRQRYEELEKKAKNGKFEPEPEIIVSPMPEFYEGNYDYFLVNGNKRLKSAQMYGRALKGIVADTIDDVPRGKVPGGLVMEDLGLEELLRFIICNTIQPHDEVKPHHYMFYTTEYLARELMEYEKKLRRLNEGK